MKPWTRNPDLTAVSKDGNNRIWVKKQTRRRTELETKIASGWLACARQNSERKTILWRGQKQSLAAATKRKSRTDLTTKGKKH
jgi:hypothetical protein